MTAPIRVLIFGEEGLREDIGLRRFLSHDIDPELEIQFVQAGVPWDTLPLERFDVFVIQRNASAGGLATHRRLRAMGKVTLYEIDELLWDLPSGSAFSRGSDFAANVIAHMQTANRVVVSTPILGAMVGVYAPHVTVIENAPPAVNAPPKRILVSSLDALGLTGFDVPFKAAVGAALGDLDAQLWVVGDVSLDGFALPPEKIFKFPVLPHSRYLSFVRAIAPTLALVPLAPSLYASCKSDIEVLDFMTLGIPAIYSNVMPYTAAVTHGENGWLTNNTVYEWMAVIRQVLTAEDERARVVEALGALAVRMQGRLANGRRAWVELLKGQAL